MITVHERNAGEVVRQLRKGGIVAQVGRRYGDAVELVVSDEQAAFRVAQGVTAGAPSQRRFVFTSVTLVWVLWIIGGLAATFVPGAMAALPFVGLGLGLLCMCAWFFWIVRRLATRQMPVQPGESRASIGRRRMYGRLFGWGALVGIVMLIVLVAGVVAIVAMGV